MDIIHLADFANQTFEPKADDVAEFSGNQKLVLLETIQGFSSPLSAERAQLLGKLYDFATSQNVEISSAFYVVALQARDTSAYDGAAKLAGQVGRMKYVRPLYKGLEEVDRDWAVKTFREHESFYHPICVMMVKKMLKLDGEKE